MLQDLLSEVLYTDDRNLGTHAEKMRKPLTCFNAQCKGFGLKMNQKKTEIMLQVGLGKAYVKSGITVGDREFKVANSFTYLERELPEENPG